MSGPDTTSEQVRNAMGNKYYAQRPMFQPVDADNRVLKNQLKFQDLTHHHQEQAAAREQMSREAARLRAIEAAKLVGDGYIKKSGSALNMIVGFSLVAGALWYYAPNIKLFFSSTYQGTSEINTEKSRAPQFFAIPAQVPAALENRDIISRFGYKHPPQ